VLALVPFAAPDLEQAPNVPKARRDDGVGHFEAKLLASRRHLPRIGYCIQAVELAVIVGGGQIAQGNFSPDLSRKLVKTGLG
jgi:hypothetical protein